MKIHEDFTSKKLTLVFDSGKKIDLSREESKEFEQWFVKRKEEIRQ